MPEKGKYIYCIIEGRQLKNFEIKGIEGKDVYTISEDRLSVVVSDSEIKEFFISRENLLAHQKVIEEVMKEYDVLPISFGTIAKTKEEIIEKILKNRKKEFEELFQNFRGKIELGLKAFWINKNSIFQEIVKNSQTIQSLKRSKNVSLKKKISAGELIASLLEEKREIEREKILQPLKRIAEDFRENKIWGDDMILNTAFLVKKTKEKEFDRKINALGQKFSQRIKFNYVGPLPPFNFVKFSF